MERCHEFNKFFCAILSPSFFIYFFFIFHVVVSSLLFYSIFIHFDNQRKSRRGNEILTYEQIVQLPRGKQLLDEYIKKASPTTTISRSGVRTTNLTNNSRAESPTPVRRSSRTRPQTSQSSFARHSRRQGFLRRRDRKT